MGRKLNQKTAKFSYSIHQQEERGPNRVVFQRDKAASFFKSTKRAWPGAVIKITHLQSGLVWTTDDTKEFHTFTTSFLKNLGEHK